MRGSRNILLDKAGGPDVFCGHGSIAWRDSNPVVRAPAERIDGSGLPIDGVNLQIDGVNLQIDGVNLR